MATPAPATVREDLREDLQEFQQRIREALSPLQGWWRRGSHADIAEEGWERFAGTGALATVIPEEYGGTGAGLQALSLALEELGAVGLGNMMPILTAIDALAVARHAGEPLKRKVLPGVAAGRLRLCLALTEAEAGFNTFNIATLARRHGDAFRITGTKIYISGADIADWLLVLARTSTPEECAARGQSKTAGLAFFMVPATPADTAGLTLRQVPTTAEGTLKQFEVEFRDVEVPAENLVGWEDEGLKPLLDVLNPERILISATVVGTATHCLGVATEHARNRRVFGDTPIGSYQSVQHPLAEVRIRQEALRLVAREAARGFDSGMGARDLAFLGNSAKFLAAELGNKAVDAAIETLGGKGFDQRYGVIHQFEFMRLLKTAPVSSSLILNHVAEHTLGLPRSY
jgi:alkylation response protein AidB-like acyl-CoA dehydrogenase